MSTTVSNDTFSSSISVSNNAESFDVKMKSMDQLTHDDSDTENEQSDNESSNNVNVSTEYQYKHMVNNQGLLVEEELNVAPFDVPEGIFVSSTVKNNDTNGLPSNVASEEQEVNLPVGGSLFQNKQIWKESGLPNFCQEVGPKSDCITNEVKDLLLDEAIEQVKHLHQQLIIQGIKNLPSMVKQGYNMVKLDIKKDYLHVLVDPQYRDLFRLVWKGSHYHWKTMPLGLSTATRIFTMLLRPVFPMLRCQRVHHRLLRRSINSRVNKRRMFIQPQKDNGFTCQTRFQVKSSKWCSQTNSINGSNLLTILLS
ncbi:hypothetical protein ACTFIR_009763 [Dictyostelium discoideum]